MNKSIFSLFVLLPFLLLACKEEENIVGADLQPNSEKYQLQFTDTSSINAYSVIDTIATGQMNLNLLGFVADPIFGKSQVGICSQFRLSVTALDFGQEAVLDSIVLTLSYEGYFGDTLKPFIIRVYELDEGIDENKTYYNTSLLAYKPTNLTSATDYYCYPTPQTINKADTVSKKPVLRIPLQNTFGTQKFIEKSNTTELENNENFLKYFKGLYIVAEGVGENGSIIYVNMLNPLSNLTLYYHNKEKNALKHSFVVNDKAMRFTTINHFNYADADGSLKKQLIDKDYSETEEKLFVQASGGVKTIVEFPYIKEMFKDKKVVINKAELVIQRYGDDYTFFYQPPALDLYYKKDMSLTTAYYLPDYKLGAAYFGGDYNTSKKEYRFRITQYIQNLIMNDTLKAYPLHLVVKGAATKANRLIFYGTNPATYENRLRLEVTYAYIDN